MIRKFNKTILALGAEMNSTFSIYKERKITSSDNLGDTSNLEKFDIFKKEVAKFLNATDTKPSIILTDLHPKYNTSVYGDYLAKKWSIPNVKIQHHRAHAFSVAKEHNIRDFTAIVCDGLGWGDDSTIWGGEIFHNNNRIGHLEQHLQIGGDSATIYPAKMLFSILRKSFPLDAIEKYMYGYFTRRELLLLDKQFSSEFNSPKTTSCGRVLDAASFLLGFCKKRTYEGQPAIMLDKNSTQTYELRPVIEKNILMTAPLFKYLIKNIQRNKARLAATVEHYIAEGLYTIAASYKKPVLFTGGCAHNTVMSSFMTSKNVLFNKDVPRGDGGISYGQIAYYLANPRNDLPRRRV